MYNSTNKRVEYSPIYDDGTSEDRSLRWMKQSISERSSCMTTCGRPPTLPDLYVSWVSLSRCSNATRKHSLQRKKQSSSERSSRALIREGIKETSLSLSISRAVFSLYDRRRYEEAFSGERSIQAQKGTRARQSWEAQYSPCRFFTFIGHYFSCLGWSSRLVGVGKEEKTSNPGNTSPNIDVRWAWHKSSSIKARSWISLDIVVRKPDWIRPIAAL